MIDPCARCEEVLQPFLDRELTEAERQEAESHLDECSYCRKRYRFEVELRRYVRQAGGRADAGRAQGAARGARAHHPLEGCTRRYASKVSAARSVADRPAPPGPQPLRVAEAAPARGRGRRLARARAGRSTSSSWSPAPTSWMRRAGRAVPVVGAGPRGLASLRARGSRRRGRSGGRAARRRPGSRRGRDRPRRRCLAGRRRRVVAASYGGERSHPVVLDRPSGATCPTRGRGRSRPSSSPATIRGAGGRRRSRRAGAAQEADVRWARRSRSSSTRSPLAAARSSAAADPRRGGQARRPPARADQSGGGRTRPQC